MTRLFLAAVAACCLLAGLATAARTQYAFSLVGNYPGATYSYALADNRSQIVGYYVTPNVSWGYIEDLRNAVNGRFLSIQPPGSWAAWLSGINSHGVAVGGYCSPPQGCNFPQGQHGFTFDHGAYTNVDYPAGITTDAETTVALGINDNGEIVGGFCYHTLCPDGLNPTDHGFLDLNGAFTELDYPQAIATEANAVNNAGVVTGVYETIDGGPHGFIYENGVFTNIDVPGSTATNVSAINNRGIAAGYYQLNFDTIHGFLRYEDGTVVTVDHPNTEFSSLAGINDAGVIVGNWTPSHGHGFQVPFKGVPVHTSP